MKQGDIWLVDFFPSVGQEINKLRRAVVLSADGIGILDLKLVAPFTEWDKKPYPWMTMIKPTEENGLTKGVVADVFQLKSVSTQRFKRKVGRVTAVDLNRIMDSLSMVVSPPRVKERTRFGYAEN
jgi:mRNA interferase MazF